MSDVQSARMPVPSVQAAIYQRAGADATKRSVDGAQLAAKMITGAKQSAQADKAMRLAAAKQMLQILKMLAEVAAASGNAKLAKSLASQVADIARSLAGMAGGAASAGGGAVTADAAASSGGSDSSAASASSGTGTADSGADTTVANSTSQANSTSLAASAADDPQTEIRDLLTLAKKIMEILRRAVRPGDKAAQAIDASSETVAEAAGTADMAMPVDVSA